MYFIFEREKKQYHDLNKCDCVYFLNLGIKPAKTVNID